MTKLSREIINFMVEWADGWEWTDDDKNLIEMMSAGIPCYLAPFSNMDEQRMIWDTFGEEILINRAFDGLQNNNEDYTIETRPTIILFNNNFDTEKEYDDTSEYYEINGGKIEAITFIMERS